MSRPLRALLPAVLLLAACSSTPSGSISTLLWMRTSAEYEALCLQAFAIAHGSLDRALADPTWTACQEQGPTEGKPPAIIVDVDETTLSTTSRNPPRAQRRRRTRTPSPRGSRRPPRRAAGARFTGRREESGLHHQPVRHRRRHAAQPQERRLPLAEGRDVLLSSPTPTRARATPPCAGLPRAAADRRRGGDFSSSAAAPDSGARSRKLHGLVGRALDRLPNPNYGDWLRSIWGWKDCGTGRRISPGQALRIHCRRRQVKSRRGG
jgi:hypothetical protein